MLDAKLLRTDLENVAEKLKTRGFKVDVAQIQTLENLVISKNIGNNTWQLTFNSEEDMRSKVFDFAQENGFKVLELSSENKTLESLFRELTLQ